MKNEKLGEIVNKKYGKQLKYIFEFYIKTSEFDSSPQKLKYMASCFMQLKCLAKLLKDFKILPALISPEELKILYKHLIRYKETDIEENVRALDYKDFIEALIRISILAKDKLGEAKPENLDSVDQRLKFPRKSYDIEGVNEELIARLLKYMNICEDSHKIKLDKFLQEVKDESSHAVPSRKLKDFGKRIFYSTQKNS